MRLAAAPNETNITERSCRVDRWCATQGLSKALWAAPWGRL